MGMSFAEQTKYGEHAEWIEDVGRCTSLNTTFLLPVSHLLGLFFFNGLHHCYETRLITGLVFETTFSINLVFQFCALCCAARWTKRIL